MRKSKYAGVAAVRVIRPVREDADGRLWVGSDRVYFIDAIDNARVRRGARAVGFHGGRPVFYAWDFYTHQHRWSGDRFASSRDENEADRQIADNMIEDDRGGLTMGGFWDVGGLGEYP